MHFFEQIVRYIIRPTRDIYHMNRLGPPLNEIRSVLTGNLNTVRRQDEKIQSMRPSEQIQASYYHNDGANPENCVVYLHANNGSRVEGLPYLKCLFEHDLNVCLFDFTGSGLSGGQYITLGKNEAVDLECVVKYLKTNKGIKNVLLWGRSMGAVTALVYTEKMPQGVVGVILDSPFKDLRKLIKQLASDRTGLPKFIFQLLVSYIDGDIKEKTGISVDDLKVKNFMKNPQYKRIPALFLVSKNDKLVKPHHGQKLYSRYLCEKKVLRYIQIQHHETRQANIIGKCISFIDRTFELHERQKTATNRKKTHLTSFRNRKERGTHKKQKNPSPPQILTNHQSPLTKGDPRHFGQGFQKDFTKNNFNFPQQSMHLNSQPIFYQTYQSAIVGNYQQFPSSPIFLQPRSNNYPIQNQTWNHTRNQRHQPSNIQSLYYSDNLYNKKQYVVQKTYPENHQQKLKNHIKVSPIDSQGRIRLNQLSNKEKAAPFSRKSTIHEAKITHNSSKQQLKRHFQLSNLQMPEQKSIKISLAEKNVNQHL